MHSCCTIGKSKQPDMVGHRILQTGTRRAQLPRFDVVKLELKRARERNKEAKGSEYSLVFSEKNFFLPPWLINHAAKLQS